MGVSPSAITALCVNTGSSSLKVALFRADAAPDRFEVELHQPEEVTAALDLAVEQLLGDVVPDVVGHRVVHGGPDFLGPAIIDAEVLQRIPR